MHTPLKSHAAALAAFFCLSAAALAQYNPPPTPPPYIPPQPTPYPRIYPVLPTPIPNSGGGIVNPALPPTTTGGGGLPAPVAIHYEVPTVEINTTRTNTKLANNQLLNVTGKLRFIRPPQNGYYIETYFICKSPLNSDRYIIQAFVEHKEDAVTEWQAVVPNFNPDDTAERVQVPAPESGFSTFNKPATPAPPVTAPGLGDRPEATPHLPNTPRGSKYEGWIVRITAGGQVIRIDASQPALADLAKARQRIFDTVAIHKRPPDPRQDTPPPRPNY